ncbi:MAG: polyketide synthase dehydratase domain-containing protein [Flavobacteriaceae bacterium]|nr:polyketide synthase dehydratase domain-containing protein [Flavobacteriaceae bacterium]
MTGANVHAILGNAPEPRKNDHNYPEDYKWPIVISAQNKEKLNEYIDQLLNTINDEVAIASLSNTLVNGREIFQESIYAYFNSSKELIQELQDYRKEKQTSFKLVSLGKKRRAEQVVLHVENLPTYNVESLQNWFKNEVFSKSFGVINNILNKLIGKSIQGILNTDASDLEQNILRFSQAFVWIDTIASSVKNPVKFTTSYEGDYLGAVFSEVLTLEEALMLFILNEDKRAKLLDRINFGSINTIWESSESAVKKEFWLDRVQNNSNSNISVNVFKDTVNVSMLRTKNVEELFNFFLYAYAKGVAINWAVHFGTNTLNKIPLPPTPLTIKPYISESYKINSRKNPKVSGNDSVIDQNNKIASILHQQLDTEDQNIKRFKSVFTPEHEGCIKDHTVNGAYIFPGSGYISMTCEGLFHLHTSHPMRLKNVQIFQPMSFKSLQDERNVQLELKYHSFNADTSINTGSWEIVSKAEKEDWILHIKGDFEILSEDNVPEVTTLFDKESEQFNAVDINEFYSYLKNWGVEYGPDFRLIKELSSNASKMAAIVGQDPSKDTLQASPELLDSCMHALFSAQVFKDVKEPFVPSRYEEITIYKPLHGAIHAQGNLLETGANAMTGQFLFSNAEGQPLLEVKSMEIRKIMSQFLESESEIGPVYNEAWVNVNELGSNDSNSTVNSNLSNHKWIFFDAKQAQDAFAITNATQNIPEFFVIDQEGTQASNDHIKFETLSSFTKQLEDQSHDLLCFAPPVADIKQLSGVLINFKGLLQKLPKHASIRLCTSKAVAIATNEDVNTFHVALLGLARTMPIEAKQMWKGVIDIHAVDAIAQLLEPSIQNKLSNHDQLAVRDANVYTPILQKQKDSNTTEITTEANWTNPILISGGLGQMGRVFTEELVKQGCKDIYLMSRNTRWLQADETEVKNIKLTQVQADFRAYVTSCKSQGISISAVSGNVSSSEDISRIAKQIKDSGVNEINIIHAAGSISRKRIVDLNTNELEYEWNTKYEGAIQLEKQFKDFNVGYTLYTSSIASLWSGDGVVGYSSANLLLDGLAVNRNLKGERTCSVRFGRFTEKGLMKDSEAEELESSGVLDVPMHDAVRVALDLVSKSNETTPSIMNIDWNRFKPLYELLNHNDFLSGVSNISEDQATTKSNGTVKLDRPLHEILQEMVAEELDIDVLDVDPTIPLFELGLDSVHSLGIRTDLEEMLGVKLSVSLIYDFNTVELLSQHLEELIQPEADDQDKDNMGESEEDLLELLNAELL